jgi:hypothetical protein
MCKELYVSILWYKTSGATEEAIWERSSWCIDGENNGVRVGGTWPSRCARSMWKPRRTCDTSPRTQDSLIRKYWAAQGTTKLWHAVFVHTHTRVSVHTHHMWVCISTPVHAGAHTCICVPMLTCTNTHEPHRNMKHKTFKRILLNLSHFPSCETLQCNCILSAHKLGESEIYTRTLTGMITRWWELCQLLLKSITAPFSVVKTSWL